MHACAEPPLDGSGGVHPVHPLLGQGGHVQLRPLPVGAAHRRNPLRSPQAGYFLDLDTAGVWLRPALSGPFIIYNALAAPPSRRRSRHGLPSHTASHWLLHPQTHLRAADERLELLP